MAKQKKKGELNDVQGLLLGYVNVLDAVFTRTTGKTIKGWLEEFRQQPRDLPPGVPPADEEPEMPLSQAYMILGLAGEAPMKEVTRRYRVLANLYHPDHPGGYEEAFKLLDRAYKRIKKEKK